MGHLPEESLPEGSALGLGGRLCLDAFLAKDNLKQIIVHPDQT
jgi:hypothetical protein